MEERATGFASRPGPSSASSPELHKTVIEGGMSGAIVSHLAETLPENGEGVTDAADEIMPAPQTPLQQTLIGTGANPKVPASTSTPPIDSSELVDRTVAFDTVDDTVVEPLSFGAAARPATRTYERPKIPPPPNDVALSVEIQRPPGVEVPRTADSVEDLGLLGVKRWRDRYAALSHAVDEIDVHREVPTGIREALQLVGDCLQEMTGLVESAEHHQGEMELWSQEARRVRADYGVQQDRVAQQLSATRRAMDDARIRFAELADEHEQAAEAESRGGGTPGRALGLRHAIRDLEDALGMHRHLTRTLEDELRQVHARMEAWSESHEGRLMELAEVGALELAQIEDLIGRLRGPLERVERYVEDAWAAS